jgi:hypothetical protein
MSTVKDLERLTQAPDSTTLDETRRDEAASRIRSMLGVTDNDDARRRRSIIHNAQETCSQCASCGRALSAGAPIWRQDLSLGPGIFGRWRYTVAPVCEQCCSEYTDFRLPCPCEGCGRPVHQQADARFRYHLFCCEKCEQAARATAARQRRSDARGTRSCETCGETFEPTRADSRFCSSACRQRAYRNRKTVTGNESERRLASDSRNAGGRGRGSA